MAFYIQNAILTFKIGQNYFIGILNYSIGILQVLRFKFLKFRIVEILNFHPCSGSQTSDPSISSIAPQSTGTEN